MHKCSNCGHEFEGKFCPECGASAEENKTCPNCGATLASNAKFCNQCGYSFEGKGAARGAEKQPSGGKAFFVKAWEWIKKHKKIVIPVTVFVVVAIILLSLIPTFILASKNGTYYAYDPYGDKIDKTSYITLTTGKWKDEDGESGTYKVKGDRITFYITFGGSKEELFTGTLKNGVLKYGDEGMEEVFVSDKHKHSHGGWKDSVAPTCTEEGKQTATCFCGQIAERAVAATGHKNLDVLDFEVHKIVCTACNEVIEEKEHSTSSCSICNSSTIIVIADNVTDIPYRAFKDCSGLTSITIPDSVTSIGQDAFNGCSGLTSITIPNSVTSIRDSAFEGCSGLTSITIPDSVTSIGQYAFNGCGGLTSVTIPDGVTSIGKSAFNGCSGLTSITIPDNVTYIGASAFGGCAGLENIIVGENNTSYKSLSKCLLTMDGKTLLWCKNDTIPNSVTSIGDGAFCNDDSIKSIIIPESVTNIGESAFEGCSGLTSITIPDSVTSIGAFAFYGCNGLTTVTIPESVTSIGDCAFYGCIELVNISIPDSVVSIGRSAFSDCASIKKIIENGVVYLDKWVIGCYEDVTEVTLRNDTKGIAGTAFSDCYRLTSITIPDSVTSIGESAFKGCGELTSITIGNGVTSIGAFAFEDCSGLTSITIPDSVTYIGASAFEDCSGLTTVTIPDTVTSIERSTFYNCGKLTSIIFSGTKARWNAVEKGLFWNSGTGDFTIQCTDGKLKKNGNEIE